MKAYIEHANITVKNINDSLHFFNTALPDFKIRGGGKDENGNYDWLHIGTAQSYIAISKAIQEENCPRNLYNAIGINHLGIVVENVEELGKKLELAGYKRSYETVIHKFRRREYFFDKDGNDFEFIEYFSDKAEERNEYVD